MRLVTRSGKGGTLLYGTNGVHYASFHQTGTRQKGVTPKQQAFLRVAFGVHMKLGHVITMPARPPIDFYKSGRVSRELRAEIAEAARAHMVGAAKAAVSSASTVRGNASAWKELERDFATGGRFDGE